MPEPVATRQPAPAHRADPQRVGHSVQSGPVRSLHPVSRLQRALGNRGMDRLLRSGAIQAKVAVGPAHDAYEHEADQIADEVMRMPDSASGLTAQRTTLRVQRACPACEQERKEEETAQRAQEATRVAHDFSQIPVHATSPARVQAKLSLSSPGDIYEQEADRVSEQVMRMSEPKLQRACACGGSCPMCRTEPEKHVQTTRVDGSGGGTDAVPPIINSVVSGPGRPLDAATRSFMEPRFGYDFSGVRIHTDARAAESTREVHALAYTVGRNVVFGAGQYAPQTEAGRQLLAHELTHVIQQRSDDHSGVVHRQPNPPNPNPNPTPPPAPLKFSASPGCIVEKTNEQIPVDPNTVTVIEYGATWCAPCGEEQQFLVELCNEYKTTKTAAPVRFFLVDASATDKKPTVKTWPPVPGTLPAVLIYSGKFQTFQATGKTTKAEVKAAIDSAIPCAKDPLKCSPLEAPAGGVGCTIQPAAVPKGKRYKFDVNSVDFAAGEEARLEADVKKIKPGASVDLLGLASSDGPAATNRVLSCQRALTATRVFARNSILVKSMLGTGPVPATDNKSEFRAVDVVVTDPATPIPAPPTSTGSGKCDGPTCVPDFVISGPSTLVKLPKFSDPNAKPADPKQLKQTFNCDPALFQIVPGKATTSNVHILHVKWKKDPPPDTLSVPRSAFDDTGDDPAPDQKAPSFAALNPLTGTSWATNVNSAGNRQACWTSKQVPSWCVPFCSFGQFTMVATVSWQCDNTVCTNDFTTQVFTINVQKTP